MLFTDKVTGEEYTLHNMFEMWKQFKAEDPENHKNTFPDELLTIILDTVNGRNDLDISGLTMREVTNVVRKLHNVGNW